MTPGELAAQLGLTLEAIGTSAGEYLAWKQLGLRATTWNRFQSIWANPAERIMNIPARTAYSLANYWAFAEQYNAMITPNLQIPRALAAVIPRSAREAIREANYRYDVAISLNFPITGDQQTFHVHVDSDRTMSAQQAYAAALDQLASWFKPTSQPRGDVDFEDYFNAEFELAGVFRLT